MKIHKKTEFFQDCRQIISMVQKDHPATLPLILATAFLDASFPFINLIFGALILDHLLAGDKNTMFLVWWMISLNCILGIGSRFLSWRARAEGLVAHDLTNRTITGKCLTMDYQQLETQTVMEKKTRADEGVNNSGGVFEFMWSLSELFCHIFTILYAIITISQLFIQTEQSSDTARWIQILNTPWTSLVMVFFALMIPLTCIPLTRCANKITMKLYNVNIDGNRRSQSFLHLIEDYRIGKDQRTYAMDTMILKKYKQTRQEITANMRTYATQTQTIWGLVSIINLLTVLIAYCFVGLKAMAGLISIGAVSMQVGAITAFADAVRQGIELTGQLDLQRKYLKEYVKFLNIPSEKYNGTLPVEKRDDGDYVLELRDVSFHYPNQTAWSLRHVSCQLPTGKKLAVAGPNGAGKTTFIKLLCRLYDPTEGTILLNGIDIRLYDYQEYLSLLSVVFQDFQLFAMKLGENVAANVTYDPARVWDCLEKAGLRERVEQMEKELDTSLYQQEENSIELSGGEAQKLALARALYKDAPIVILDEPTAALDPVSEYEIYSRFGQLVQGKTSIYISHRMSSCRFCDEIFVFDQGTIVQRGNHETLLANENGLYSKLWHAQAQHYEEQRIFL